MTTPRIARILIVDDSAVMRSLLRTVISTDKRLETVGTATDGASALRAMDALRPDLILLDVEMPVMDGLSTLKQMRMRGTKVPVIMCSSLTQRGARVTIEALASGAADYVAKPSGQPSRDAAVQALASDLIPKILVLTSMTPTAPPPFALGFGGPVPVGSAHGPAGHGSGPSLAAGAPHGPSPAGVYSHGPAPASSGHSHGVAWAPPHGIPGGGAQPAAMRLQPMSSNHTVLVIGVSTGGPAALDVLLPTLPASFPLPVLVVQHMPELFTKMLAERLATRCPLRVREATSGEPVRPGAILVAKGNWHMEVATASTAHTPVIRLQQEAPENHCRPAVDVLFRSAVQVYGSGVLGVILTGMGSDGFAGCRLIREHAGTVLAQDQATSAVWGMPGVVAQAGMAHRVLPLNSIAPEILRLAGRGQREAIELRESTV